jgi:hypothetical protein
LTSRLGLPTAPVKVVEVPEELIRLTPELSIETPRTRNPCAQRNARVRAGNAA